MPHATCYMLHATCSSHYLPSLRLLFYLIVCSLTFQWLNEWTFCAIAEATSASVCVSVRELLYRCMSVCVCGHVHDPSLLGAWQFEMPRCRAIMASWPLPRPLTTEAAHQPPCGSSINAATPALTLMQQNWSRCKWKRPWGDADAAAAAVAAAAATAAVAIYIQTNQHTHTHTYAQRVHMSSFTYASV